MSSLSDLQEMFGSIDIYLFDQLLKGRLALGMSLLDAGCGNGRNLIYFMQNGYSVYGVDHSSGAITQIRALAAELAPKLPPDNFRVESVDSMSFANETFDVVLSSAVLHFAQNEDHWLAMVREMWRVLKPGGIFFARLASTIGIQDQIQHLGCRIFRLPGGTEWFLVDAQMLEEVTSGLGGEWLEPFKTVVVHNKRSMSTWCLRKR
jgi:SAM-dependent methyltransferase